MSDKASLQKIIVREQNKFERQLDAFETTKAHIAALQLLIDQPKEVTTVPVKK